MLHCFIIKRIFWSNWETGAIHSVDKNTGTAMKTLVEGLKRPTSIFIHKDDLGKKTFVTILAKTEAL